MFRRKESSVPFVRPSIGSSLGICSKIFVNNEMNTEYIIEHTNTENEGTRKTMGGRENFPSLSSSPEGTANSSTSFVVCGDPNRLQQIVWNLLSNALKFTPKDGRVEVRLLLSAESSSETLQPQQHQSPAAKTSLALIRVSDTGSGISPDFLPHVFERFRQADGSITRHQGGLGLGLAIVRYLVEMHGGSVHAESPGLGQGATFTVKLPLISTGKTPQPEEKKEEEEEEERTCDALGQKNEPSPNNPTINRGASRSTQEGLAHFSSHSPGEEHLRAKLITDYTTKSENTSCSAG